MKVYLAGKIAASDWRHDLVPGLRSAYTYNDPEEMIGDHKTPMIPWHEMAMKCGLTYVGPYFASCDHGCAHSSGYHAWNDGCLQSPTGSFAWRTIQLCREAIEKCDLFFAWMGDGETAYGTLVEIGIASTLNKKIVISWPSAETCDELWFAAEQAHMNLSADNPVAAFSAYIEEHLPRLKQAEILNGCESPLEIDFYTAYMRCSPTGEIHAALNGMVGQYPVAINGITYRLDFAIPEKKIAFEMDGYTYHGKEREHFNRDRRRDLNLKLAGWDVHRFDGDLIRADAFYVVELAAKLAEAR